MKLRYMRALDHWQGDARLYRTDGDPQFVAHETEPKVPNREDAP